MCKCILIDAQANTYVFRHACMDIYTYVHTHFFAIKIIYVYTYIRMYICIYRHMHSDLFTSPSVFLFPDFSHKMAGAIESLEENPIAMLILRLLINFPSLGGEQASGDVWEAAVT